MQLKHISLFFTAQALGFQAQDVYYSPPVDHYHPTTQLAPDTMEPIESHPFPHDQFDALEDDYPPPTLADLYLYRFDPATGVEVPLSDLPEKKFSGLSSELALFDPWFKTSP
ncbi:hypothetical protein DSO57_1014794 [Entomophthora muscae]|uniref:Uncharacterized protein n=2 Tax=Entomophthora muscae TaxID=34485 RepID=A0ACC2UR57_9FUNG|nr:hypothetical protein DSO57_1036420 [Entomophthora muscae]KAJ9089249.1 hypothetical protein DSO57_1014794 [Entomophthora muscae]